MNNKLLKNRTLHNESVKICDGFNRNYIGKEVSSLIFFGIAVVDIMTMLLNISKMIYNINVYLSELEERLDK
jgi:hypothetical protein